MEQYKNLIGSSIHGYLIEKKLGSGGYGSVYLGIKEEMGKKYYTAIKHIIIPEEAQYEEVLQQFNYDKALTKQHFTKIVEDMTSEINTMLALNKKDNRYIVAYYDHEIKEQQEPLRFDVFIRMEYLVPLTKYMRKNGMTLDDVLQLGIDMCDALTLCHNNDVMHRDIKEANIFISESGNFKLGDFGVAKTLQEVTKAASMKGTSSYMAPEIHQRKPYDTTIDIYSLGIVLYKLLNHLRLPFMPDYPAGILADDVYIAETRRLNEEMPPLPMKAQNRLGEIILRACAVREKRYKKAEELKADLVSFRNEITEAERNHEIISRAAETEQEKISESMTLGLFVDNKAVMQDKKNHTLGIDHSQIDPSILEGNKEEYNPYYEAKKKEPAEKKTDKVAKDQQEVSNHSSNKKDKKKLSRVHRESTSNNKLPKEKKQLLRHLKIRLIGVSILAIILAVGGVVAYSYMTGSIASFKILFEEESYVEAKELYNISVSEKNKKATNIYNFLKEELVNLETGYIEETMAYDQTLVRIQAINDMNILNAAEVTKVLDHINELRTSRKAYIDGKQFVADKEYEAGVRELRKVIAEDKDYAAAQELLINTSILYKEVLFASVKEVSEKEGFSTAISLLNEALEIIPNDADIKAEVSKYESQITTQQKQQADEMIVQAETLANEGKYQEAIVLLNKAKEMITDTSKIEEKIETYEAYLPVSMFDMTTYFNNGDISYTEWTPGADYDNLNSSQYTRGWKFSIESNGWYTNDSYSYSRKIAYVLDGKYTNFIGTLATTFDSKDKIENLYGADMKVYGDGKLLWEGYVKGGIRPIQFDIDVTDILEVEIVLDAKCAGRNNFSFAILDAGFINVPVKK